MKENVAEIKSQSATAEKIAHTPGPWTIDEALSLQTDQRCYLTAHGKFLGQLDGFKEANARLIAAAPELLEACREIIDGMVAGPNSTQKNVTSYAIHKVTAAIAKAEGKQ